MKNKTELGHKATSTEPTDQNMSCHRSLKRCSPCPSGVNTPAWVCSVSWLSRKTVSVFHLCLMTDTEKARGGKPGRGKEICISCVISSFFISAICPPMKILCTISPGFSWLFKLYRLLKFINWPDCIIYVEWGTAGPHWYLCIIDWLNLTFVEFKCIFFPPLQNFVYEGRTLLKGLCGCVSIVILS